MSPSLVGLRWAHPQDWSEKDIFVKHSAITRPAEG